MALEHAMIEPFIGEKVRQVDGRGAISYGLSSYGYDLRVADEFKIFTNIHGAVVDPKNFNPKSFIDVKADFVDIPPNSFALARSVEYIRVPPNVLCLCIGKSTYARCGIILNTTPFGTILARVCHPGDLEHHPAAGAYLCQRGHRPGAILRERRGLRERVWRGEISGPAQGDHAAAYLRIKKGRQPGRPGRRAQCGSRYVRYDGAHRLCVASRAGWALPLYYICVY